MSGLEVVVRPVVLPNIRPQAARVLAPEDDPTQGIATLGGSGGRLIDLMRSFQTSVQRQLAQIEKERTYDVDKIKQKNPDGSINENNFIRVETATGFHFVDKNGNELDLRFAPMPRADNVETEQVGQIRKSNGGGG